MRTSSKFLLYGFVIIPLSLVAIASTESEELENLLVILFLSGILACFLGFVWPERFSEDQLVASLSDNDNLKFCKKVGQSIHKQIQDSLRTSPEVFTEPKHLIFFASYLDQLIWSYAEYNQINVDAFSDELKKNICDGVLPKRLWDAYQRGVAMREFNDVVDVPIADFVEMGKAAGWADAKDGLHKFYRLAKFLNGQDLALGFELDKPSKEKSVWSE